MAICGTTPGRRSLLCAVIGDDGATLRLGTNGSARSRLRSVPALNRRERFAPSTGNGLVIRCVPSWETTFVHTVQVQEDNHARASAGVSCAGKPQLRRLGWPAYGGRCSEVNMPSAKASLRAEQAELRDRMRALGLGYEQIAAEFTRRYRFRPRAAWRQAYGWSLNQAADQINATAAKIGLDRDGRAAMIGPHLSEYEQWPGHGPQPTGRKPTPHVLALLALTYGTPAVHDLLDMADYDRLSPTDLLILDKRRDPRQAAAGTSAGPLASETTAKPRVTLVPGNDAPGSAQDPVRLTGWTWSRWFQHRRRQAVVCWLPLWESPLPAVWGRTPGPEAML